jgi:hypothetical protein
LHHIHPFSCHLSLTTGANPPFYHTPPEPVLPSYSLIL